MNTTVEAVAVCDLGTGDATPGSGSLLKVDVGVAGMPLFLAAIG